MRLDNTAVNTTTAALQDFRVLVAIMLVATLGFFIAIHEDDSVVFQRQAPREPLVFTVLPEGDEVPRLAPIKVTFTRAPLEQNGTNLIRLEPPVDGTYVWLTERTIAFQPAYPGLLRGHEYTITVPAQEDAGHFRTVSRTFTTGEPLDVVNVVPAPDDFEVPDGVQVLVQFSRSVAPLTVLSEQPQGTVLSFTPPLSGRGEWLNTALYRFVPDPGALRPNTTYEARVAAELSEELDGVLSEDYVWSFTSYGPALVGITPDRNTQFVGPDQAVVLEFNQPMSRSSVEAGVRLTASGGPTIPGSFTWSADSSVATFDPANNLSLSTRFELIVPAGLDGANGGETATEQRILFETVGLPRVAWTAPASGATDTQRYSVNIEFSNPMDEESFDGRLAISSFKDDDLFYGLTQDELRLSVGVSFEASTSYTVTLSAGITDRYGQPLPPFSFSFTTGQREPSVTYAIPNAVATYSSASEPVLYYHAINTPEVTFTLYPLTRIEMRGIQRDNFIRRQGRDAFIPSQAPLAVWTEDSSGPLNEVALKSTSLSHNGGPLPRGDYLVRSDSPFGTDLAFSVVDTALVTKTSFNELLIWALDLATGEPLANLTLTATGPGLSGAAGTAATDASGLAVFPIPGTEERFSSGSGDSQYLVETASSGRYGVGYTGWQYGTQTYEFNLPSETFERVYVGHIYTERPIYRTGEEVYYKGVVRDDDDAVYSVPEDATGLKLKVEDSQGKELLSADVKLNEFGTFAGSFTLPEDAATGDYGMSLTYLRDTRRTDFITGTSFLVAQFRRPEFQVQATALETDYISGENIAVDFEATFYFGGAVEGAKVDWTANSTPTGLRFEGYERFSFSDYDYFRQSTVFAQPKRGSGSLTTDASGVARVEVPALIEGNEGTQSYQVSAGVLDATGQVVGGSATVLVHPASLYAGIRPQEYIAQSGEASVLELVSVDVDGKPVANQQITVNVYKREWITTKEQTPNGARRYRSEPQDTLIATLTATTNSAGEGSVSYTPETSGTLRLVAEITDPQGRVSRSASYLWTSSRQFASWRITNDDTLELIADKEQYVVGDTAVILVPAPFEGAIGLVTVERGKLIEREVRRFATNSERIQIPIEDIAVPDVFVSVVLYRPPTAEDPTPRYKVGYVQLMVSTDLRLLDIKITPSVDQAEPGETVRYDIEVKDSKGRGVRSELAIAVVDKAVLSLTNERTITGLRAFWFERGLGVTTASSLSVSVDRSNDVISEASTGGKGGGGLDDPRLRQEFRNTAYWEAQLVTDDKGRASVDVKMPDNLTTWRMQVLGISGDILVGEATNELVSTQPLLIRPALPRFLRVGDNVSLRALVRNATRESQEVSVSLEAEGVQVTEPLEQTLIIAPGSSQEVAWPATVSQEGTASLKMTARAGDDLEDAVLQQLPIYLDVTPETTATGGVVTDEQVTETIYIPAYTIQSEGNGSLYVGVQASLTGSVAKQVGEFYPTPHESTERIASRVIATLAAAKAEPGATLPFSETQLSSDVASLISLQRGDGGWPWCRVCVSSDPQVTGWVLQALGAWKDAGHDVSGPVLERSLEYVNSFVQRFRDVQDPADPNMKAYLLYSLAAAGRQVTALSTMRAVLEQDRRNLANWARAYLLLGFAEAGLDKEDAGVQILLNDLATNVIPSANGNHWEDARIGSLTQSGPRTTALVLQAIATVDGKHPLIEETARWLVISLNTGVCRTSLERAQAIVSLSSFVALTGERGADFSYAVRLDDAELLGGHLSATGAVEIKSVELPITKLTAGQPSTLELARDYRRKGRMYYTVNLRYVTPATEITALNRGFAISHVYSLLDDAETPVSSAHIGDVVRVRMTVMLPADRNYVVVEDFLPAGLEPIDPDLDIVEPALRSQLAAELAEANRPDDLQYYAPWFRWYYDPWQQSDLLDDRVRLSAERLAKGVYEFIYYARATTPGDFFVAPSHVEETYFPEVFGRSDSSRFVVEP